VFAAVFVPNFSLQSLLRHEPELRQRPAALVEAEGANLAKAFILECTRAAEAADVSPGQTAPQAQARCRELVLKSRSPATEQSATEILLQTAYAFSPHIENTAPGICTIDLRGLGFTDVVPDAQEPTWQKSFDFFQSTLTGSMATTKQMSEWAAAIVGALQQLGLEAQVGIASTPNLALLAARAAKPVLLVERAEEFFHSLPFAALEPTPQVFDIVKRWGIHTAGPFLALNKEAISERLGAEALELFHRTSTQTVRPLNIVMPADTFEEQMDFEAHIETIEPLLFVLRRFVDQITTRIALTYRVVAELQLKLTLETGALHEHKFKVPAPTANVETLFRMLHTHLENLRTDAPIISLRLSATPARAEAQQFGLFESALRDPNHFHETLARLTALLGSERVGSPVAETMHLPDSFRMQSLEFGRGSLAIKTEIRTLKSELRNSSGLCLRRFRPPVHADVELREGRPQFVSTLLVSARIRRARGPWCISGTWWDKRRWSRQEWDVETEEGEVYRLRNVKGGWVLEGVYD
jgi:protein ImuB